MNVSKVLQSVYVKFKKNIKRNSDLSNKVFDKVAFDVNKENGHGQNQESDENGHGQNQESDWDSNFE